MCPEYGVTYGSGRTLEGHAYRRDRRKDQLLQENGYFVLRFLAEDVGKELDAVLDALPEGAWAAPPVSSTGRASQIRAARQ